ncbi:hypothetical protein P691DRAFT_779968 [Macrolepiota fuliginosa MF-IS2]|uniref:Uncharacterized protein n=1 Tax=Macrolepiota fuliginosa MF-IS2 TaxID=1400762 RepID=A0A9P6BWN5_9AGAR|nr:hypothetical protein P691DRAFT_779968 [Macrolepiota fuliginosa MF-IS2]
MPHKPKHTIASNAPTALAFKPSNVTQCFLAMMNQDCHASSSFTVEEYSTLVPPAWRSVVMDDLLHMQFRITLNKMNPPPTAPIKVDNDDKGASDIDELSPTEELTNTITAFGQWFKNNNITDDVCPGLIENIRHITMMFSLIPAPHHCPTPPPCTHLHQANALPCTHLHADNIPTPPPKAASQTPAPSHEASMPPPPHAAVATLPAAAASIPPAGPQGCASYTGAAARNLNPAAPPFVHGPPHTPVAQPPAQAQQPISSKHSKQPFFVTRGPSHHQFFIKVPAIPPDTSLPTLVNMANRALVQAKSTLKVDSARLSPCGITCATASVPSSLDLDIIEATLSSRLLGAHVSIPASQSFIKIIDVPFFKPDSMDPFTSTEVDA